jgi:mannitol-1-/sugar-/sorbitol-6-/2-deoxyglucose-6-phosphatase
MIKAVIFDMDGLLIDSEPFWREAEGRVFESLGLTLTPEMFEEVMGLRIDEVVKHWYNYKPWSSCSLKEVEVRILTIVEQLIREKGELMEGVLETITYINEKNVKIALASASPLKIIDVVLNKFNLRQNFKIVHSAQFEEYGKPNPSIYINTAKQLSVSPSHCLVFEDSFNGLIAAKAARMMSIAIPSYNVIHQTKFDIADFKFNSLTEFGDSYWHILDSAK